MALTSFKTWFSSPTNEAVSDSAPGLSGEEHATTDHSTVTDENEPPSLHLRFAFTPTQVKQRPRAWQRKPATPFAPRSDTQKIWKRVPLQNVASNVNAAWERGGKSGDGIMRPVKKLRIAPFSGKNIGTAYSTAVKWDRETSPVKSRRHPKGRTGVDVEIYDSETACSTQWPDDAQTTAITYAEDNMSQLSDTISEELPLDSAESPPTAAHKTVAALHQPTLGQSLPLAENEIHTPADKEGISHQPFESSIFDKNVLPNSEAVETDLSSGDGGTQERDDQSDNHSDSRGEDVQLNQNIEAVETGDSSSHSQYYLPNEHDDTSYLQAFLSRSRAQREAKSQPAQALNPHNTNVALVPAELQLPSNSPIHEITNYNIPSFDSLSLPTMHTNGEDDQEPSEDPAGQASSPCRRSSRITRLPRPQKPITLPNTISLRRLNGTEFVAMQKETHSLAIATRTNTKRNKGSALNVRQRLAQLHAEKHPPLKDDKMKNGKGVEWLDVIARMQGQDGAEVAYVPDPRPEKQPELSQSDGDNDGQEHESEPAETQKLVRKRRRDSLGNVNGTPAPRKTAELLWENTAEPSSDAGEHIHVPNPTPMKRTKTRTRSHG